MTFRTRLLLIFTVAVAAAVGVVELVVSSRARQAFEDMEAKRAEALVTQFNREIARRGLEVMRTVENIAASEAARNIAISPEPSSYVDQAAAFASTHGLDLLELVAGDGTIVSSAEWPARFGYKEDWLTSEPDWQARGAFLKREELPEGVALALMAVGTASAGDRKLYVAGGRLLDREFLSTLVMPAGMRVLLYRNLAPQFSASELIGASGPAPGAARLESLIEQGGPQRQRVAARRVRKRSAGRTADRQLTAGPGGTGSVDAADGDHGGGCGHPDGDRTELVGHGAHHAAGAATGGERRKSGGGRLGRDGGSGVNR